MSNLENITGTKWCFNDNIIFPSSQIVLTNDNGLFKNRNNALYNSLTITTNSFTYSNGNETLTMTSSQLNNINKTILFINEPSLYSPDFTTFITWLQNNATRMDALYLVGASQLHELASDLKQRKNLLSNINLVWPETFEKAILLQDIPDGEVVEPEIPQSSFQVSIQYYSKSGNQYTRAYTTRSYTNTINIGTMISPSQISLLTQSCFYIASYSTTFSSVLITAYNPVTRILSVRGIKNYPASAYSRTIYWYSSFYSIQIGYSRAETSYTAREFDIAFPYAMDLDNNFHIQGSGTLTRNPNNTILAQFNCNIILDSNITQLTSSTFFSTDLWTGITGEHIINIGNSTFQSCYTLISISFPICTTIGSNAFQYCSALTSVNFPACTSIGSYAFQNCSSLTTVNFPACTSMGDFAFGTCYSLTTANFPVCTSIKSTAFQYCSALTSINFPVCTSIGIYAFQYCSALTSVNFPACTTINSYAFYHCSSLTTVNFPVCTTISISAFAYCDSLTTINFPVCTLIYNSAFKNCSALISTYFLGSTYITLSNSTAFQSTPMSLSTYTGSFGSIYVPNTMLSSYKTRTNWSYYSNRLVGVPVLYTDETTIASNAYKSTSYWGVYESQCTSIGSSAFQSCTNLVTVYFPVCTTIESQAFQECSALTTIHFPVCTSIGYDAFYRCPALTFANFPACSFIGSHAFQDCSALTSVNFPVCTTIEDYAFQYCFTFTTISFPVCSTIGASAFRNCSALTSVNFPVCTSIGSYAFRNCTALTSINFPMCTFIDDNAFRQCTALISAYFLNSSYITFTYDNVFMYTPMEDSTYTGTYGSIYVRASMLSSYKTRANWSYYSNRLVGLTDEQIAALNL